MMRKQMDNTNDLDLTIGEDLPPLISEDFMEDNLRDEIFRRTTRALRRRVWTRRAALALSLVLVYSAGLATPRLFTKTAAPMLVEAVDLTIPAPAEPQLDMAATLASADAVGRYLASATPTQRVQFYQAAGDWYLEVAGDPARAAGCYRQMLIFETRLGLVSEDTNETWMLASLRREQTEDVNHVQ